jgi:serine/threonine protein kinase
MEKTWIIKEKYEVISKIKQGGFGVIYYGFDRKFEKPVAIKAIEPSLLQEAKYIDLFLEEAKNAAKLNHNNIVHVYDLIKENGQFYIIMEYIDGIDLRQLLKKSKAKETNIPVELSVYIIKEICKALEYAHNKIDLITKEPLNLIHQDISPSNIMISVDGHVKLIDFGIAKIKFNSNGKTNHAPAGKLPYMSPEQLNGNMISKHSDIFSLGSVFFEVLTGDRLFQAEDDEKIIELIKKSKIDQKLLTDNNVPDVLHKVLVKALKKDPIERYQGANGIYIDLVEYLMSEAQSIELSIELSKFINDLFKEDINKNNESDTTAVSIPDEDTNTNEVKENSNFIESIEPDIAVVQDDTIESNNDLNTIETTDDIDNLTKELNDISEQTDSSYSEEFSHNEKSSDYNHDTDNLSYDLSNNETEFQMESINVIRDQKEIDTFEENQTYVEEKRLTKFSPTIVPTEDAEEGEDDIKTVIDVIRLSAKNHKRPLIIGSIITSVLFITFMVLNVSFRWTGFGEVIYDRLFPPAIKIQSTPPGASIYIDDELKPGKTPLTIDRITPGVHKLTLSYAGFPNLSRSITIPSKGMVEIAGEKATKSTQPHLFRFKTKIELISEPAGATIYINNVKYNQRTPTTFDWEVGIPLNIELSNAGFEDLTGFSLNTLEGTTEIEDRRLWNCSKLDDEFTNYLVEGSFKKFINISSVPSEVTFYLDHSTTPSGIANSGQAIALSVGSHDFLFTKAGFNSKEMTIAVDQNSSNTIVVTLTRNVRFFAKDATSPNDNDIGATLARIYRKDKNYVSDDKTPCEIQLPPYPHQVLVKKNGYKDEVVSVPPTAKVVVIRMEPDNASVEITVVDALTNLPLKDVQISYSSVSGESGNDVYFGFTDENGKCSKKLNPGKYSMKAKKYQYFDKTAILDTTEGSNKLKFELIMQ